MLASFARLFVFLATLALIFAGWLVTTTGSHDLAATASGTNLTVRKETAILADCPRKTSHDQTHHKKSKTLRTATCLIPCHPSTINRPQTPRLSANERNLTQDRAMRLADAFLALHEQNALFLIDTVGTVLLSTRNGFEQDANLKLTQHGRKIDWV